MCVRMYEDIWIEWIDMIDMYEWIADGGKMKCVSGCEEDIREYEI